MGGDQVSSVENVRVGVHGRGASNIEMTRVFGSVALSQFNLVGVTLSRPYQEFLLKVAPAPTLRPTEQRVADSAVTKRVITEE